MADGDNISSRPKIDDGGPAFPTLGDEFMKTPDGGMAPKSHYGMAGASGMTLRDYSAIKIFAAMRASGYDNTREVMWAEALKDADAFIKARQ